MLDAIILAVAAIIGLSLLLNLWRFMIGPHTLDRVIALDTATGEMRWSFTAGARVDSPPTVHGGRGLFGSRDGRVYCLRAEDGALVWRFRAAPEERLVVARGQLESAWPLHGSVLVNDGTLIVAAGRSSYLDGGIHEIPLPPPTPGRLWLCGKHAIGPDPEGLMGRVGAELL